MGFPLLQDVLQQLIQDVPCRGAKVRGYHMSSSSIWCLHKMGKQCWRHQQNQVPLFLCFPGSRELGQYWSHCRGYIRQFQERAERQIQTCLLLDKQFLDIQSLNPEKPVSMENARRIGLRSGDQPESFFLQKDHFCFQGGKIIHHIELKELVFVRQQCQIEILPTSCKCRSFPHKKQEKKQVYLHTPGFGRSNGDTRLKI